MAERSSGGRRARRALFVGPLSFFLLSCLSAAACGDTGQGASPVGIDADASVPRVASCITGFGLHGERTQHVVVSDDSGSITLDTRPGTDTRRQMEIRVGSELYMQTDSDDLPDGQHHVVATFGPLVEGVRVAEFWSDGKVTTGTLDGRAIEPFTVGAPPETMRYADTLGFKTRDGITRRRSC